MLVVQLYEPPQNVLDYRRRHNARSENTFIDYRDDRDTGTVTRMDDLKRAKIKRRAQRTQASKIWSKAQTLMDGEMDEAKCKRLQVILETYNAKIELLRKLDEAVSSKIDDEKDLETEIAEADDYLIELTEKRYQLQFLIESNQNAIHDNAYPSSNNGHDFPKYIFPSKFK